MEDMNGMTVTKILRIIKMTRKIQAMITTTINVEVKVATEAVENTDVPKEMSSNPPEIGTATEAAVDPELIMNLTAKMNTIASTNALIKALLIKHPVQKS
jgi:hypothetical protein